MTLDHNAEAVRAQGGVPSINHPNFRWAVRQTDVDQLADVGVFEVFNAGPDRAYTTTFIGRGGEVLDEAHGAKPRYLIRGSEGYVRARIIDSDGGTAWVQPYFLA